MNELVSSENYPLIKIFYVIEDKRTAKTVEKYLIHFLKNIDLKFNLLNDYNKKTVSEYFNHNKK